MTKFYKKALDHHDALHEEVLVIVYLYSTVDDLEFFHSFLLEVNRDNKMNK